MHLSTETFPLFLLFFPMHVALAQNNCTIVSTSFGYLNYKKLPGNFNRVVPLYYKRYFHRNDDQPDFQWQSEKSFCLQYILYRLIQRRSHPRHHHSINGGFGNEFRYRNKYSAYFKRRIQLCVPSFSFPTLKPGIDMMYMWGYDESWKYR